MLEMAIMLGIEVLNIALEAQYNKKLIDIIN